MQFILMLFFVTLTMVIDAAMIPRVHMPIKDLVNDTTTSEMPSERYRPFSFPKTLKKFVVTPMPRQPVTEKTTRKPLMKKIFLQNFTVNAKNDFIKQLTQKPAFSAGLKNRKRLNVQEHMTKEKLVNSPDKKDFTESKETNIDSADEEIQIAVYPINEMENNNAAVNKRNSRLKRLLQLDNKSEEYLDWQEYIFLSPSKQVEREQTSIEVSDEFITTENILRPGFSRIKRSNNIIEEENLGTTVAGYKFTWHDTRLTNNLVFKNIHS